MSTTARLIAALALTVLSGCFHPTRSVVAAAAHSKPYSGIIDFGTGYRESENAVRIVNPSTIFRPGQTFSFVAHLREIAHASRLSWTISKIEGDGTEKLVFSDSRYPIHHPSSTNAIYDQFPVADLLKAGLDAPGSYVMRFSRGSVKLAEGRFALSG